MAAINLLEDQSISGITSSTSPEHPELADNLMTQLAIFEIRDFLKTSDLRNNKEIKYRVYVNLRIMKFLFTVMYSAMVFFEKPFWCYQRTTVLEKESKIDDTCDDDVAVMGIPILDNTIYRVIEIFFLMAFILIQVVLTYEKIVLGQLTMGYKFVQGSFIFLSFACFMDIFLGLILKYYPIINFSLRGVIIILLVRNLREAWTNIFKLLWSTRTVFFLLFCNMLVFSLIAFLLFKEAESFKTFHDSFFANYILLTTCNFPDVMLETFPISKLSIIYFTVYILIDLFILLSLLKALYYSNYIEIYKINAKKLIHMFNGGRDIHIANEENFHSVLISIHKKFSLTQDEYNRILETVGVHDQQILFLDEFRNSLSNEEAFTSSKIIRLFRMKRVEIIINIVDLLLITLLFINTDNTMILLFQMAWCGFFLVEYFTYLRYIGFRRLLITELIRSIFFFVNLLLFLCIILIITFYLCAFEETSFLLTICKPLIILRSIRIIILLNMFPEFKAIFITIHNMKTLFYALLANQFSLFFMFSTLSMLLTGGTIKKHHFDNVKDIPNDYYHVNFNDYGSSFLSCFCLLMVNNINILSRSLSFATHEALKGYFSTFYFLSTLIILNIIQTLILELYLTIKKKKIIEAYQSIDR